MAAPLADDLQHCSEQWETCMLLYTDRESMLRTETNLQHFQNKPNFSHQSYYLTVTPRMFQVHHALVNIKRHHIV